MNRATLLLADLPNDTWSTLTNLQIATRYNIPPPVVRRFRREASRPAQPAFLSHPLNHRRPDKTASYKHVSEQHHVLL